jgi:hypothetical protein
VRNSGIYLSLQGINDVQRSDGLSLGMFSISDCITNDSLKEDFEDSSSFLVDETGDSFYATTASETTDCGFGDALYEKSADVEEVKEMKEGNGGEITP